MQIHEIKKQIERIENEEKNINTQYNKRFLNNRKVFLKQKLQEKENFILLIK